MKVQAELSLYPLRQPNLTKPIQQFVESLAHDNLYVKSGAMSSVVRGESQAVFHGIQKAFEQVAQDCDIVLTIKISNACRLESQSDP
jgi:uncharacterized protein YqgV (UPF0045/DUF77 family)